jgi:hypothetical protein
LDRIETPVIPLKKFIEAFKKNLQTENILGEDDLRDDEEQKSRLEV